MKTEGRMDLVNICTTLIYTFPLLFKFPLLMRQKNKQYEFHTRVFVKSWLLWTDTERVQAKREPSWGTATTTLTYFVWRCYFAAPGILPHILRPCFLKSKLLPRDRFPQLGTDKCTYNHMQFTYVLTNAVEQRPFWGSPDLQMIPAFCRNRRLISV